MTTPRPLDLHRLTEAIRGSSAAIRLRVRLQPAGGAGTKVFPPTYAGGVYVTEKRLIDGQAVDCVLLDSVQSQANRLEQALLQAYRDGSIKFPLLSVQFPNDLPDIGEVTALDAPHRAYDAILRDSELGGVPFRPQVRAKSDKPDKAEADEGTRGRRARGDTAPKAAERVSAEGTRLALANTRYATPLFELCPTALIFGAWDSTGAAGGLGNKFARAVVSEIVGINVVAGKRASSRIDPLGIEKGEIYEGADGSFVVLASEAKKDKDDKPILFKRKGADKGKPSEINHGNVTPDIVTSEDTGEPIGGGVTLSHAEQTTLLSLAALRRLRFPGDLGQGSTTDTDVAARTVLAALSLAAVAHQMDPPDYFLRSNCQLVLETEPTYELVTTATRTEPFTLSAADADRLFADAVVAAKQAGLPWREEKIVLKPKKPLVDLVRRSRELGGEE